MSHGYYSSCNKPFNLEKTKLDDFNKVFADGYRGISARACEKFGIHSYTDNDGNVLFREYTAPDGSKFRRCPKEGMWQVGTYPALQYKNLWNAGSAHYVTVVEGEEDAAAFDDIMNTGKTQYPVVSLSGAGISRKGRKEIYDYLSKFETVKLAFESDTAGNKAKAVLREMLPNKIKEVSLTKYKDANEYLQNNAGDEFKRAWNNAQTLTPDNIYHTEEDVLNILKNDETESGFVTPFGDLNDVITCVPMNHVVLITGQEGIGKTEFLRSLEYAALKDGYPIAVMHQEETKKTYYRKLASYEMLQDCNSREEPVAEEEILSAIKKISNEFQNLFVFEFKQDPDVNTILEQVKYLVHVCGVKYVFVDPINQFDPVDDTPKVEFLDSLSKKMAKFVANNPVGMVWTAHVNDEGKTRDSRMISKSCSIRIDTYRDVLADDPRERNTMTMTVGKNRPFGTTGFAGEAKWKNQAKIMEDDFVYDIQNELPFKPEESYYESTVVVDEEPTETVDPF